MRLGVLLLAMIGSATGCFSFSQFDREEEARTRREWTLDRAHVLDPVEYHAQRLPIEGLDPPGPRPLVGPRRDPDTVPRARPLEDEDFDRALDAWEALEKPRRPLEQR